MRKIIRTATKNIPTNILESDFLACGPARVEGVRAYEREIHRA
jgi:hypothetical protein